MTIHLTMIFICSFTRTRIDNVLSKGPCELCMYPELELICHFKEHVLSFCYTFQTISFSDTILNLNVDKTCKNGSGSSVNRALLFILKACSLRHDLNVQVTDKVRSLQESVVAKAKTHHLSRLEVD